MQNAVVHMSVEQISHAITDYLKQRGDIVKSVDYVIEVEPTDTAYTSSTGKLTGATIQLF